MEKYEKLEKVGEGTYGKVYKAKDKLTGQLVALKKTRLQMDEEGVPPTALREVSLLQMLSQSLYVVRLLSVEHIDANNSDDDSKSNLYLVFEFLDTDLKKFIDSHRKGPNPRPLSPSLIQSFLFQLCKGVAHCHSHGVLHRDLKPHNLLLDQERGILKIADLGLGRAFTVPLKSYTHEIVTLWYRAPEVLLGSTHYSIAIDMWSVGCIFAEMSRRQALFPGDSELQQLLHIFRLLGTPTEEQWPGVTSLRDWHVYPKWEPQNLARAVPSLGPQGVDLLSCTSIAGLSCWLELNVNVALAIASALELLLLSHSSFHIDLYKKCSSTIQLKESRPKQLWIIPISIALTSRSSEATRICT
ncbi:cell division control protein 2 [Populus alba x Populus x berolinensis]|uniref:Cell division control protein 2 n=1 Tax=Populus alba x Populus x berolinensis TaxID=444605 RepID=A0AAD6LLN7_9ROSI|nr:cell division control protein 2 [Populus alba x Populus x berolinensis]KAJ6969241.1 cell division control protein 2 [Populus alba x Populus x berolinensis]